MPTFHHYLTGTTLAAMFWAGCGKTPPPAPNDLPGPKIEIPQEWPGADDPQFAQGRSVWLSDCENCHGIGKAGSPRFTDTEAWAPRLKKGEAALIASAINGFEGNTEAGMPPRGGNKDLTDDQIAAAVRYMTHFSRTENPGTTPSSN